MLSLEIEKKALLDKDTYNLIIDSIDSKPFIQKNYYFDDNNKRLYKASMALRVREKNGKFKLTLKDKSDPTIGIVEVSSIITKNDFNKFVEGRYLIDDTILEYLSKKDIVLETLTNLVSFTTKRIKVNLDDHILFLDETTFENGVVDYELEVESSSIELCKKCFDAYADKFKIKETHSTKIERGYINKKNEH